MALLATQTLQQSGLTPALADASSGGDTFEPSSTTILLLANSDSQSHTVTITVTATLFGQPVANVTVTIPAAGQVLAGPFEPGEVADPTTGYAAVGYSDAAVISIAVLEL